MEKSRTFAKQWGSEFVDFGDHGHINVAAGFGAWEQGEQMFTDFLESLSLGATF